MNYFASPPRLIALRAALPATLAGCFTLNACTAPAVPSVHATHEQLRKTLAPAWQAPLPHAGEGKNLINWWLQWNDPVLNQFQSLAQTENPSLALAQARIEQARAQWQATGASSKPGVDLSNSLRRSALGVPPFGAPRTQFSSSVDASWELDLFGALAQTRQASAQRLEARQLDWHEARVSLAAEIATSYLHYRVCGALLNSLNEDGKSLASTVSLTEQKVSAGFSAPAEAALLRASLANSRNQAIAQRTECHLHLKALAFLSNSDEATAQGLLGSGGSASYPGAPAFLVGQLPAQTLAQRPDLAALERELAALAAEVGVAEANRKPRLTLSGNVGWGALRFGGVNGGETGSGLAWGFGPALNLPIFDGGRRLANVRAAAARYQEVAVQYRLKAKQAVREVEEAMLRLDAARQRQAQAEMAVNDFLAFLAAAETRYRVGVGNLIEFQEARRQSIAAQLSLLQLQRERSVQWIALYKALGGGWDAKDTLETASVPSTSSSR
jgi:outer membrane protein, multidrug efflux system